MKYLKRFETPKFEDKIDVDDAMNIWSDLSEFIVEEKFLKINGSSAYQRHPSGVYYFNDGYVFNIVVSLNLSNNAGQTKTGYVFKGNNVWASPGSHHSGPADPNLDAIDELKKHPAGVSGSGKSTLRTIV